MKFNIGKITIDIEEVNYSALKGEASRFIGR